MWWRWSCYAFVVDRTSRRDNTATARYEVQSFLGLSAIRVILAGRDSTVGRLKRVRAVFLVKARTLAIMKNADFIARTASRKESCSRRAHSTEIQALFYCQIIYVRIPRKIYFDFGKRIYIYIYTEFLN